MFLLKTVLCNAGNKIIMLSICITVYFIFYLCNCKQVKHIKESILGIIFIKSSEGHLWCGLKPIAWIPSCVVAFNHMEGINLS